MRRHALVGACLSVLLAGCQSQPVSVAVATPAPTVSGPKSGPPPLPDLRLPSAQRPAGDGSDGLLFDSTDGSLHTDSGSTALASTTCNVGGYGHLTIHFGAIQPHYYSWRVWDYTTGRFVGDWAPIQQVPGANVFPGNVIATPGRWLVAVAILHQANGYWYLDAEVSVVHNRYAPHQRYCEV